MAELAFEMTALALESTRGTAVTPPTHLLNMEGTLTPMTETFIAPDQDGSLAEIKREETVHKWSEYEAEGGADPTKMPLIGNMAMMPLTAGVAAGGEVTAINVTAGGTSYETAPTVTITAPDAGGRQATAHAVLTADAVTSVVIDDPGSHYTAAPTIGFTGGGGAGATATATVSATATTAKQWEFIRAMAVDNIKTATWYWGDPNQVVFKAAYGVLDEFTVSGDASGTDGVTVNVSGFGQFPTALTGGSIPALPALTLGPLLMPGAMQVWINATTLPFGTTAVTGRVVSAEVTVPTGVTRKFVAAGPAGGLTYDHIGRDKVHPELTLSLELLDQTQYDLFANDTYIRVRVKFNNTTAIEGSIYPAIIFDIEGKLSEPSWGDLEGTNRTIEFTLKGRKSDQLASDLRMIVINSSATL